MTKAFSWITNTDKVTIQDLMDKITTEYPEMEEDIENAKIVIFIEKERWTMANDKDLQNTLKGLAKSGFFQFNVTFQTGIYSLWTVFLVDLEPPPRALINFLRDTLTAKKAYNKWSIGQVLKDVLGSEVQDYTQLPRLDIGKFSLYKSAFDIVACRLF